MTPRARTACWSILLLILAGEVLADDPSYYRKKATWHETMHASSLGLQTHIARMTSALGVHMGPWYAVGPFTAAAPYREAFGPETDSDLDREFGQGRLRWVKKDGWSDGKVIPLPTVDGSANYMTRDLVASRDTTVTLYLGSDDGIRVWMNGRAVLEHEVDRGCQPNQETLSVSLREGTNQLLLKVNNGGGPTAFYFSLFAFDPDMLWNLVERDFTSPDAREEIAWERSDRIWDGDWRTDGQLARSYADATRRLAGALDIDPKAAMREKSSGSGLWAARNRYVAMRRIEKETYAKDMKELTPPGPGPEPAVHGPKVYGVRPRAPFLYTIPATGERPMTFGARELPAGLVLDSQTGRISGTLTEKGEYRLVLTATNHRGTSERPFRIVVGDLIALTPPLGWNSWNCFAGDVDDGKVRSAADAMVASGLADHGWTYINIDDCWMVKPGSTDPLLAGIPRDDHGRIQTNKKFRDMKSLGDYVHAKGLKLGIYSSPGTLTCAEYAGSYTYELQDAQQYAEWGVDYLKYDWCSYSQIAKDRSLAELQKPYQVMRAALNQVERDILYSLCQYGWGNVWEWGADVGGNCWRTTGDITDTWESMSMIGFGQAGHERFAGPGHWNDPDMLVVGWVGWGPRLHPTRLTPNEQRTHISLWTLLASPLLIGCDLTRLDEFTLGLLTNDEVLEVHQDPLGRQASRVSKNGDHEVWARPLEDGTWAAGLFNRSDHGATVSVRWTDLGMAGKLKVRDLWRKKDLGVYESEFAVKVARHGAVLMKVSRP
jgi:alpha-galactosidase